MLSIPERPSETQTIANSRIIFTEELPTFRLFFRKDSSVNVHIHLYSWIHVESSPFKLDVIVESPKIFNEFDYEFHGSNSQIISFPPFRTVFFFSSRNALPNIRVVAFGCPKGEWKTASSMGFSAIWSGLDLFFFKNPDAPCIHNICLHLP